MLLTLGKLLAKSYGLLLTMAVGGLVCANLFGFGAFLVHEITSDNQHAPPTEPFRWWMHCGWMVGVGLALVGAVIQNRRSIKKSADKQAEHQDEPEERTTKESGDRKTVGKRSSIFSSIAFFSFAGGFLGLMLGGSLLLFWFSIAYSPFTPAGWASSISVEQRHETGSGQRKDAMTTKNPVALYTFGIPIALGGTAGALIGGIGAAMGKVEDG